MRYDRLFHSLAWNASSRNIETEAATGPHVTGGSFSDGTITFSGTAGFSNFNVTGIDTGGSSPLTTKGDLYTYSTEAARLPVGTNGYVLAADSTESTGLKWVESTSTNYYLDGLTWGTDSKLTGSMAGGGSDVTGAAMTTFTPETTFTTGILVGGNPTAAGYVTFHEDTSDGTNYLKLQAAAMASSLTFTLPNSYPASSGYALVSTDAGVMSWAANDDANYYVTGGTYSAGEIDFSGTTSFPDFTVTGIPTGTTTATNTQTFTNKTWNGVAIGDTYISSATNWNDAYNNYVASAAYSAGTLTFTQRDGGTFTATGFSQATIGGSISANRIPYASSANTVGDSPFYYNTSDDRKVEPVTDAYYDLGDSDKAWRRLYVGTAYADAISMAGAIDMNTFNLTDVGSYTGSGDITITKTSDSAVTLLGDANRSGENSHVMAMRGKWDGTVIGTMMIMSGPDTTNKDDGQLAFYTASAGTQAERMRIDETGRVGIGTAAPTQTLDVRGTTFLSGATDAVPFEVFAYGAGTSAMHVTSGSDTGLGTATPLAKLHINAGAYQMVFQRDTYHHTIVKGNSDDTLIFATGAPGSHTTRFKVMPTGIDVVNDAIVTGTMGVGGLITASGGVTLPATSDNFTMGGNAVNDILIDGDSYPGSSQDDYLITAKYLNTVSGAIVAAGGGGTIGGSITDNQIAFGATTTDSIEGSSNLTFDGNHMTLAAGKHIYFNDTDASIHAGADSRLDVKGDSVTFASGSTEVMRVNGGGVGIFTSSPSEALHVEGSILADPSTGSDTAGTSAGIKFTVQDDADVGWNLRLGDTSDDCDLNIDRLYSSAWYKSASIDRSTGDFIWYDDDGSTAKMIWDASTNNLGIGTTTPTQKLQLKGDSTYFSILAADGSEGVSLGTASSGRGIFYLKGATGGNAIYIDSNGGSYFDGGYTGFGTTSPDNSAEMTIVGKVYQQVDANGNINYGSGSFAHGSGIGNYTGYYSSIIGIEAGHYISGNAHRNTAIGYRAMYGATTGQQSSDNTAIGASALYDLGAGNFNVAVGSSAGGDITGGEHNIYVGYVAGRETTIGHKNIGIGSESLYNNIHGDFNIGIGSGTLYYTAPSDGEGKNIAIGTNAGAQNTTGTGNIFIGDQAANDTTWQTLDDKLVIANSATTSPLIYGDFGGFITFNVTGNAPNSFTVTADQGAADGILVDSYEPRIVLKNRRSSGNDSVAIRYDNATPSLQIRTSRDSYAVPMAIFNDDGATFGINAGAWGAGVAIASGASFSLDNTTTNRIYRDSGVSFWDSTESYRLQGNTTSGYLQLDMNKISLVRDASSAASNVLQIGDGGTYDQFSIVEDQRGSTATNGLLYLRAKKTGNFGYATLALRAASGSNMSEMYINGISTNEAFRFDTNSKSHALDIAKAGYVSIGAAVSTTDALYVNGTTTINGTLSATAKSFNIEHPLYKDKRLVHGSLEGPEHGIYIRGSIESKEYGCLIELPEYWEAMCDDYTVQLTPHGPYTVYIKEKQKDKVMIACTSKDYKFDYYVVGSRTDETLEVVQDG